MMIQKSVAIGQAVLVFFVKTFLIGSAGLFWGLCLSRITIGQGLVWSFTSERLSWTLVVSVFWWCWLLCMWLALVRRCIGYVWRQEA